MITPSRAALATLALTALLGATACTGGAESKAADGNTPLPATTTASQQPLVTAQQAMAEINPAIPIYDGADFREDLTRRDEVMIRNKYGASAAVYTLASDDSFPQIYHYYTTYLAQFRAFPSQDTYPSSQKNWRTLEIQLNQVMQDPFIPGEALDLNGKQVTLQVAETETEPKTVIRYIVTPRAPAVAAPVATVAAVSNAVVSTGVVSNGVAAPPVTR